MAKPKNAYLAKKDLEQRARDTVVYKWSLQMVFDALTLVLNDPAVMGKDVFGEARLNKLNTALCAKANEVFVGLSGMVNASYVRAQVDRELQKICKDSFVPWEKRYDGWDDKGI